MPKSSNNHSKGKTADGLGFVCLQPEWVNTLSTKSVEGEILIAERKYWGGEKRTLKAVGHLFVA